MAVIGSLTLAMELPQLHTEHQNRPTEHLPHPMAPQSLRMKRLVQIMAHQVQITEHQALTTEPQPQFTLPHPPSTEARHMELPLPQLSRLPMLGINGRRTSRRLSTQTVEWTCLAQQGKEDLMNATVSLWLSVRRTTLWEVSSRITLPLSTQG